MSAQTFARLVDAYYQATVKDMNYPVPTLFEAFHGEKETSMDPVDPAENSVDPAETSTSMTLMDKAEQAADEQWRRTVFLEDPFNSMELLDINTESAPDLLQGLEAVRDCYQDFLTAPPRPSHLRPVSAIQGKLPHLIDLKVVCVERVPSSQYTTSSQTVADWSFFVLADSTGAVVAAFQPELPSKLISRAVQCRPDGRGVTMTDLMQPGDVVILYAVKTISLFGSIMVTFSKQSRMSLLGSFMMDYSLDFGVRKG